MGKHTIVIEFAGDEPAYSANMELLGGRVVAVAFADELERCEQIEIQRDELLEGLEELFEIGDVFNSAIEAKDPWSARFEEWAVKARAAIARARGEA
jgi:hypothetical protein